MSVADHAPSLSGRGRVYVVDDDSELRISLEILLNAHGYDAQVVENPLSFLNNLDSHASGIILLDVRMPDIDGIEFLEVLDGAMGRFAVIVMSGHGDIELAVRAIQKGAKDFLEKPLRDETLRNALDREFGRLQSDAGLQQRAVGAKELLDDLSDREREVLDRLMEGKSNKVIAFELEISIRTVEMHRARMMDRLRCKTLAEAIALFHLAQPQHSAGR